MAKASGKCGQLGVREAPDVEKTPHPDGRGQGRGACGCCFRQRHGIRAINKVGRKGWKEQSKYHRRSLVETALMRRKSIFGEKLSARRFDQQATEMFVHLREMCGTQHNDPSGDAAELCHLSRSCSLRKRSICLLNYVATPRLAVYRTFEIICLLVVISQ